MHALAIRELPSLRVAAIDHEGPYLEIGRAFDRLFGILMPRGLVRTPPRLVGIYLDDPTAVPQAKLRSRAGIIVDEAFPIEAPLSDVTIAARPHAVLSHCGPYADMKPAYDWLFGKWLVQSGREAADAPVFEEYLNSPRDTAPSELRTDIHLPLRPEAVS